ncbi:MAG: hypothetical protein QM755_00305 [Luteolibacter sp.]
MTNEPLDPYAPPAADPVERSRAQLWRLEKDVLIVRTGAELPEIDLYGHNDTDLVHHVRKLVTVSPILIFISPLMVLAVNNAPVVFKLHPPWWTVGAVLPVLLAAELLIRRRGTMGCYIGKAREHRRRIWLWIGRFLAVLTLAAFSGEWFHPSSNYLWLTSWLLLATLVILIGPASNRLGSVRYVDGWFHLSGLPRITLVRLRKLHPDSPSDGDHRS